MRQYATQVFFVTVPDRSAATLIPIITRYILPGTTIVFDCWKSYSSLRDEGFFAPNCESQYRVHVRKRRTYEQHWKSVEHAQKVSAALITALIRTCTTHISLNTVFGVSFFLVPVTRFWHFSNSSVWSTSRCSRPLSCMSSNLHQSLPVRRTMDYFRPRPLCQHPCCGMTKYRVDRIDHRITASTVGCYLGTVKIWPMNYCHTHNAFWSN